MMRLAIPWPPAELQPNARTHWRVHAKVRAAYREQCRLSVLEQIPPHARAVPEGALHLRCDFVPPTRAKRDRDNLLAAIKSGLDGVAEALGFDDGRFAAVTIAMAPSEGKPGKVLLTITRLEALAS